MADVKQIKIGNTNYDIKDETARGIATASTPGRVKPDGTTITVDANGTISATGGGGGGGHTIENSSGTDMTARSNLQFLNSTVTDDSTNDRTIVSPANIQTTTTDPGEGSPLATNCLLIVIEE